jgi:hypothetical protein
MSEEATGAPVVDTPATEVPATSAPAVTTPTSFIGEDGTFTEGWRDQYVPENVRGDAVWDRVKTIQGAMGMLAHTERMKGADTIAKPSDRYEESDWEEWYNLGGRPQNPQDYGIAKPENMPDELWNGERYDKYSELFHRLGLNKTQVDGIIQAHAEELMLHQTNMANDSEANMAQLKADLLSEWGNAFEQKKHLGNAAIEKGTKGDPEFKERLLQKFGNDPDFIKFASNVGGDFSESGSVPVVKTSSTPTEIQDKINEIMASPAFMDRKNPGHKRAVEQITRLTKEKFNVRLPA